MGDHIWVAVILVGITSPVRNVDLNQIRKYVNVGHLAILSPTFAIVMFLPVGGEEEEPGIRGRQVLRE
jgi:hypothetical protein